MDEKLQAKLEKKYPKILKDLNGDPSTTCMSAMHGGISCGDGWYDLIDKLMHSVQFNTDRNYYPQLVADQIKEKFGTLRFYHHFEDNPEYGAFAQRLIDPQYGERPATYLEGMISFAENMSNTICENCGQPGKQTSGRWIQVLCTNCEK